MRNCKCRSNFTNFVNANNHANASILIIALTRMLTLAPHNVGVTASSPVVASPHAFHFPIPPGCAHVVPESQVPQSSRFGHWSPRSIAGMNSHEDPSVLAPADPTRLPRPLIG